jgi:hypothetical protein
MGWVNSNGLPITDYDRVGISGQMGGKGTGIAVERKDQLRHHLVPCLDVSHAWYREMGWIYPDFAPTFASMDFVPRFDGFRLDGWREAPPPRARLVQEG